MEYPVVTFEHAQAFVAAHKSGSSPFGTSPRVDYRNSDDAGEDVLDTIEDGMAELARIFAAERAHFETQPTRDGLEGLLVEPFHQALRSLPAAVLTDRDFWRYLATVPLFEFATWRDRQYAREGAFPGDASYGAKSEALHPDTVSLRMFNRGQISVMAAAPGEDGYAVARPGHGDLWKSHVLRGMNGNAPLLVKQMVERSENGDLPSTVIRDFVKRVKRARANILLETLNEIEVAKFVKEQLVATLAAMK